MKKGLYGFTIKRNGRRMEDLHTDVKGVFPSAENKTDTIILDDVGNKEVYVMQCTKEEFEKGKTTLREKGYHLL